MAWLLETFGAQLRSGGAVLDVAGGAGGVAFELAFRRGLEARFVTGTLTERAPAGPGELASILRMRAVLDEPPDAWDALCGEECTIEW